MRQRFFPMLMAIFMLIATLPIPAYATEADATLQDANSPQFVIEDQTVQPGSTFTVPLLLRNNPGIAGFGLNVDYSTDYLEMTIAGTVKDIAEVSFGADTSSPYQVTLGRMNDFQDAEAIVAELTFKVKDGVTSGIAEITPSIRAGGTPYNQDDLEINNFEFVKGTITIGNPLPTTFTVIWLDGDGSELDRKTYNQGQEEPTTDRTPTKAEDAEYTYTFTGWDSGTTEGTTKTYRPNFNPVRKVTDTYTVIWLNGDGSELDLKTYTQGQQEPTTDRTPTKAEDEEYTYTFTGWDSGTTEGTTKTYRPNFDSTRKNDETYTVTYDGNGGEGTMEASTAHSGESITLLPNGFTHPDANQVFRAWRIGDTEYNPGDIYTVNGNTTITAIWRNSNNSNTQGCYVATAVYGSYDCPEVWTLRRFRDRVLAKTWYGRLFIRLYYAVSPTAVRLFGRTQFFQDFFRNVLDPWVADLQANGFDSTPYQDRAW